MSGETDNLEGAKHPQESDEHTDSSSRRAFLRKSMKRAAYIAPIIWTVSAQHAIASTTSAAAASVTGGAPVGIAGVD